MFLKEPLGARRATAKQILMKDLFHILHGPGGLLSLNHIFQACVKEVSTVELLTLRDLRQRGLFRAWAETPAAACMGQCCCRGELGRHVTQGTGDQLGT